MQRQEISGSESLTGQPGERWTFNDADDTKPAPKSWTFRAYNAEGELIATTTAHSVADALAAAQRFPITARVELTQYL